MRTMEMALVEFRRHLKVKDISLYDSICDCQINPILINGYPIELHSMMKEGGLALMQEPLQFTRLLRLAQAHDVKSFIQIGIGDGGDFILLVEYLASIGRNVTSWAIDPNVTPQFYRYVHDCDPGAFWGVTVEIKIIPFHPNQFPFGLKIPRFDLGIVDSEHGHEIRRANMMRLDSCSDMLAVHDVSEIQTVMAAWNEYRATSGRRWSLINDQQPSVEITNKPICGYGILWPKDKP